MSGETLFSDLDQAALEHVTTTIGIGFAAEVALVAPALCDDETISPGVLRAGIAKAHLLGLAAAIASRDTDEGWDELAITGATEFLRTTIADLRRNQ